MDRSDFSRDRPGAAANSRVLKSWTASPLPRRLLVASLALALAACASRGAEPGDNESLAGASISDEATDQTGEFVVNRALLRQARDELAVMSQPATAELLDAYAHNRPPRPVNETRADAGRIGPADLIDAEVNAETASGRSTGGLVAAVPAAEPVAEPAAQAVETARTPEPVAAAPTGEAADQTAARAAGGETAAGTEGSPTGTESSGAEGRPGLFGRMFGWMRPDTAAAAAGGAAGGAAVAAEAATAGTAGTAEATGLAGPGVTQAGAVAAVTPGETIAQPAATTPGQDRPVDTAQPAGTAGADATPARAGLPGPGEPGYIVSGHSSGGMQMALEADSPVAAPAADPDASAAAVAAAVPAAVPAAAAAETAAVAIEQPVTLPVIGRSAIVEREAPALAPVTVAPAAAARPVSPQPGMAASLGSNPAVAALPPVDEVPALDERMLERGNFATLMGAMHGMVERCEPPTQMRDEALKNYRLTYPAVELDRGSRDDQVARIRLDEEFVRSAAATLGSSRVNCDYVRSQSYGWNQLVGDLRHMSRDSARQYRPGLITEISRGAGIGRF